MEKSAEAKTRKPLPRSLTASQPYIVSTGKQKALSNGNENAFSDIELLQNLCQEVFEPVALRMVEDLFGRTLLDNLAAVHKDDA